MRVAGHHSLLRHSGHTPPLPRPCLGTPILPSTVQRCWVIHHSPWSHSGAAQRLLLFSFHTPILTWIKPRRRGRPPFIWPDLTTCVTSPLSHPRIDVHREDKNGRTPLHVAVQRDQLQVVPSLLSFSNNIDPVKQNNSHKTSLHDAAEKGYDDVLWLMLDYICIWL